MELKSLIFSFTIVFSLEMVHKPKTFMYKSTLKMTDLQGRILSSWLFSFLYIYSGPPSPYISGGLVVKVSDLYFNIKPNNFADIDSLCPDAHTQWQSSSSRSVFWMCLYHVIQRIWSNLFMFFCLSVYALLIYLAFLKIFWLWTYQTKVILETHHSH